MVIAEPSATLGRVGPHEAAISLTVAPVLLLRRRLELGTMLGAEDAARHGLARAGQACLHELVTIRWMSQPTTAQNGSESRQPQNSPSMAFPSLIVIVTQQEGQQPGSAVEVGGDRLFHHPLWVVVIAVALVDV